MNVCQRNVACFGHVECRFDKINDVCQGFGSLVSWMEMEARVTFRIMKLSRYVIVDDSVSQAKLSDTD